MNSIVKRTLVIAGVLSLLAAIPAAQAQEDSERASKRADWKNKSTEAFSKVAGSKDKKLAKCESVEAKISERTTEDKRLQGKHKEQYAKLVARIEDLIAKATTAGYDTAELSAQLVELKEKIATFETDKAAYIAALRASQTAVCGKTEGEFKEAIVGARTEREQLKADVAAIHTYVKETIKPTVRALRKMVQASASPTASPTATPTASPSPSPTE